MISGTKVKIRWDKKEEVITLAEAWDRYVENQKKGGPLKLEFFTYNALKNVFEYQYPAGFFKNEGRMQDVVIFRINTKDVKEISKDELDIPVAATCKLLIHAHNIPSLLSAQAIKSWNLGRCNIGVYANDRVVFVPIVTADNKKDDIKYKYPAKGMSSVNDVFRVAFRDNSSLVTEFLVVG